jgi:hypothetical protein
MGCKIKLVKHKNFVKTGRPFLPKPILAGW